MDDKPKKSFSSKVSIVGLFAMLTFILTIPLAVLLSQQQQTFQQHAAVIPTVIPTMPLQNQTLGYISGYVYQDDNQNGERDTGEKSLANITLKITKDSTVTTLKTDVYGHFKLSLQNDMRTAHTYLLQVMLPKGYKTIDTNPILLSDLSSDSKNIIEFGLFPLVLPSIAPTCIPRPPCLDRTPHCLLAEPAFGWCPKPTSSTITPITTCSPRPPQCGPGKVCPYMMPSNGWCQTTPPLNQ